MATGICFFGAHKLIVKQSHQSQHLDIYHNLYYRNNCLKMSLSNEVNRKDLLIGFDKKHWRFINIFLGTMGKGLTYTVGLQKKLTI